MKANCKERRVKRFSRQHAVEHELDALIKDVESKLKVQTARDPASLDMTHIVPRRLYERMKRLEMDLPPFDDREFEGILAVRLQDIRQSAGPDGRVRTGGSSHGTEATTDDGDDTDGGESRAGARAKPFELTVEQRTESRQRATEAGGNWMERFLRKTSNERIRWQTKYYRTDQKLLDKPLFQQIEELIDLGAQDFSEWLNGLGAEKSNITRDIIKQLFSIEIEDEMARAIRVDTKEVRAIPAEAAYHWNLESMALQKRIAQVMRSDRRAARASRERHVAFGRTLPVELRTSCRRDAIDSIRPDFPDDLRTLKALFKDIRHLRSVRYLIEHLHERAEIQRPRYLTELGLFRSRSHASATPFYQKVLPRKVILDSVRN
ncbi:AGAP013127-PA-like protein [Anopheles sinensis]|uniref:AGAP013127-PA-like protein n=1 Tax=Anopheles sinensis TaxID=74873 RepID=A0A084VJ12_ANOSI|nr:AGAP013127-PA-like protein [Anopheles sinensis]